MGGEGRREDEGMGGEGRGKMRGWEGRGEVSEKNTSYIYTIYSYMMIHLI